MEVRLYTAVLLALYQLALVVGIVMLPIAMVTERLGIRLPVDRAISGLNDAYDRASA